MTSPVETIADALVAFILSLLRDPDAAEGFVASPEAALARNGLEDVCMADVAAVRPVIVDHPHVINQSSPPPPPADPAGASGDVAVREIVRMIQQYTTHIDARSTILDQSVNQNIWTEGGDVTQVFDQEAVIASGDNAVAAGDDATVVDSDVDVTVGDVSVGNETNDGSFNETGTDPSDDDAGAPGDAGGGASQPEPSAGDPDSDAPDAAVAAVGAAVDTAVQAGSAAVQAGAETHPVAAQPAPAPADVPEPADLLESDMTAGGADAYDSDAASAALDDQPVDIPVEDD